MYRCIELRRNTLALGTHTDLTKLYVDELGQFSLNSRPVSAIAIQAFNIRILRCP